MKKRTIKETKKEIKRGRQKICTIRKKTTIEVSKDLTKWLKNIK